ncbi:4-hydroxy-tetrahydrodipicolinate synthase [Mangrovibacterium marinum]|uniref:4-hydroxy-tetrahydrodipicolinate synthase n=1 Tax=Mangrovibacterium marinum TaxID=1639118 RepID=A0A2T5C4D8_9BACT|nr:4-hydroxy-tetrahydrodipicolinate synthase [Mangrovibacterium marinum]PTN09654.1 dihydrodipicolinate synthase [Mangrovibacterium marinum]
MEHLFKGAGVALITPFKKNLSIDFNALETLVEEQITSGTDYLVALGTTAETPTLSADEQKEVINCIKAKVNKRVPIMLGLGGNDPVKVCQTIKGTNFDGIDGILSVTPYYNRPPQAGLIAYYKSIAAACPVPVVLYNVPSRTGVNMESATSVAIAKACPNVIAVKEASGESSQVAKMAKHGPAHFAVISGDDVLTLPIISVGGIGVISVASNALPGQMAELVHLALDGRLAEARQLHQRLVDLFKLLFREGNPAGVKALMEIMGKTNSNVRLPLCAASSELYKDLEEELKRVL